MSVPMYYQHYPQGSLPPYQNSSTTFTDWREPDSQYIELNIRQQPREGLVTSDGREKARKPIDPPPIVEMKVSTTHDPQQHFLQSPYFFMTCELVDIAHRSPVTNSLVGMVTSSLHRLKDVTNRDGGFFVFGDLSAKKVGTYLLHFCLFDLRGIKEGSNPQAYFLKECWSDPFKVLSQKEFKGLDESTYLSRAFSDQGVRLRLRKEPRAAFNKKRSHDFDSNAVQPINASEENAPELHDEEIPVPEEGLAIKRARYETDFPDFYNPNVYPAPFAPTPQYSPNTFQPPYQRWP